ncbi:hypothetical protein [Pseudomonas sp. Teo4]|uniref:hypothetical protein n=1 Tax=Pseudomonas sp. Teo4 TaxID=3064528 RepID=UPI002ACB07B8|nr:hypothetical protein [Pseudomonas sp. Teo4]
MSLYAQPDDPQQNLWELIAELVVEGVPTVAYFPTFLINVPEEIELAPFAGESYEQRHYREIVEKIFAYAEHDVDEHINKRIAQYRERNGPQWLDTFYRSHEKGQIDAVFKKVSQALTTEVIGGWRRVFSRETTAKRVELQWSVTGLTDLLPWCLLRSAMAILTTRSVSAQSGSGGSSRSCC